MKDIKKYILQLNKFSPLVKDVGGFPSTSFIHLLLINLVRVENL